MAGPPPGSPQALLATILFLARVRLFKRYTGSALGVVWSLLQPITTIAIMYFAFSIVLQVPISSYSIYLAAGILPWGFLTSACQDATRSLAAASGQMHGSPMPHVTYVLADLVADLISFLIAFAVLIGFRVAIHPGSPAVLLALPLVMTPFIVFVFSAGIVLAFLTPRFRDIPHLLGIFFGVMFWLMPIVYHWSMVPPVIAPIVKYNPFALLIAPIQVVMHAGELPSRDLLLADYALAAVAAAVAIYAVRRFGRRSVYFV